MSSSSSENDELYARISDMSDDELLELGLSDDEFLAAAEIRKGKRRKWIPEPAPAGEDRLSSLTDELVHKIMSFMNTKYAVQTCVLSKRWQSLWKSLPYLDFHIETFPFKGDPGMGKNKKDRKIISFNNFISQFICQRDHNTDLVKVRVKSLYTEPLARRVVQQLITSSVDYNVQELTFMWTDELELELPGRFYTCQSMAALYIHGIRQLPKPLALPALKSLHFHRVKMSQNFLHPSNFAGCPNLETLKLRGIRLLGEDTTLLINAPNLKSLKLSFERFCSQNRRNKCKVVIDAPGLATFRYRGYAPILSSSGDLAFVDDAYFDIYNKNISSSDEEEEEEDEEEVEFVEKDISTSPEHVINSFKEFRHAKSLTLSLETVEALAVFPDLLDANQLPFANLKHLKIKLRPWQSCNKVEIPACVMNFFLNNSVKFKICE